MSLRDRFDRRNAIIIFVAVVAAMLALALYGYLSGGWEREQQRIENGDR